jgi:3-oxoacyl-(acyl-carrier-protein) synthase
VGEGAAFLVLESLEHATARGARPLAEIVGYGANADAGHLTHPDAGGVRRCLELALVDAGVEKADIGYVNAHGTGTVVNDQIEAEALARLFGDHAPRVAVSSIKAITGHAMGASGALEALATVLTLHEQRVAPTAHLGEPDPALPALDFVRGAARSQRVEAALSSSLAFGGNNAVLALRRARLAP